MSSEDSLKWVNMTKSLKSADEDKYRHNMSLQQAAQDLKECVGRLDNQYSIYGKPLKKSNWYLQEMLTQSVQVC